MKEKDRQVVCTVSVLHRVWKHLHDECCLVRSLIMKAGGASIGVREREGGDAARDDMMEVSRVHVGV